LMLLGLLDLRRCLLGPLLRIRELIQRDAPAAVFHELGEGLDRDFGELAGSIGSMLGRLDETGCELRRREQALENLYQNAPAAMVSIGPDGRIIHANRRAADLFETADTNCLLGADLSRYVRKQDRGVLRQSIGRLGIDRVHRCEIRIEVNGRVRDLDVEFAAVQDEAATPGRVRLSMLDVTDSKRLLRQVTEQQRLLDLVVNSMSDALVLVSVDATVMTANQRLGQLLHADPEDLEGRAFDPETFWAALHLQDAHGFKQRMAGTPTAALSPLHEQYEGRYGSYLFHVIPICDEPDHLIARLWVVQDVTDQVQAKVLLDRQRAQLRTLHRLGQQVLSARSIDAFLQDAVTAMSGLLGIESLGVAVRHDDPKARCKQLFWLGGSDCGVEAGQRLRGAVETELLPSVLRSRATTFWSDLSHSGGAVATFAAAGLEAVAATPLYTSRRTLGVVWIARRGGQRIERDHLFLLEAMAPVLSASLENLQLRWEASVGSLRHPLTQLEAARQLDGIIAGQLTRRGQGWSVMVMALDGLDGIVERHGLPAAEGLLRGVAELLGDNCRACDRLVHDEQDRFVIVMPDTPRVKAIALAHRLKAQVAALKVGAHLGRPVGCTASFGLAGSPQDHDGDILSLELARRRLAEAVAQGPGTIRPDGRSETEVVAAAS
ncbi:MAG: PAS domain-containing protein, partial [Phycisphaerae bacterium]|nr:PAS domain-containing protein [Phycisphaerae bacterium]